MSRTNRNRPCDKRDPSPVPGTNRSFSVEFLSKIAILSCLSLGRVRVSPWDNYLARAVRNCLCVVCLFFRFSPQIIYPPPLPLFRPWGIFTGERGGCIFWTPLWQEFYTPPFVYTLPTPGRVFSGVGRGCIKFGPQKHYIHKHLFCEFFCQVASTIT